MYGDYVPVPGTYELLARSAPILLTDVSPTRLGNNAAATLTLEGAGFDAGTTVSLVASDNTSYPATTVSFDALTRVTATFAAASVPSGHYSVRVENAEHEFAVLADAFEMLEAGQAQLVTNIVVPANVGYHEVATVYVEYANTGTLAMPAPLLEVTAEQNGARRALLTLDLSRVTNGFWTSAIPEGFSNSVQFLASGAIPGELQPGESFRVPVYWAGWQQPWDFAYPPINFLVTPFLVSSTEPIDWASLKDSLRPERVDAEAWEPIWTNFQAQVGGTWGNYVAMLDENATYLGRLGQQVNNVSKLLAFEYTQAAGLCPSSYLATSVDAALPASGLALTFGRVLPQPINARIHARTTWPGLAALLGNQPGDETGWDGPGDGDDQHTSRLSAGHPRRLPGPRGRRRRIASTWRQHVRAPRT